MKAAVLTANFDSYDDLRPFRAQDVECETICVTDDPTFLASGWRVVYEPSVKHPNLAAKSPKMCPWRYTDADLTIWIDASFVVLASDFVRSMCGYSFAQFTHPSRDCIYDELEASRYGKYEGLPLDEQVSHYRAEGHPEHWGLWATGVIVRRRTPQIEAFGEAWLAECEKWSFQDQLSEAPMLRAHALRPDSLPGSYSYGGNPWVGYAGSARH